ncbi:MAG: SelT/SelW/SelH family protein [Verrucomicrobiota bacterium]
MSDRKKPVVTIEYCPGCRWLLRSSWMSQELLSTFEPDLEGVLLKPSEEGGRFQISIDGTTVWDRVADGGFPGIKELKQRVRDFIDPSKDLGHLDGK